MLRIAFLIAVVLAALVIAGVVGVWAVAAWRKGKAAMNGDKEHRRLAEEYQRLTEATIAAREHTDRKLTELAQRIEQLGTQLDAVQSILKDVE